MNRSILQNRSRLHAFLFLLLVITGVSCNIFHRKKNYETHESRFPIAKSISKNETTTSKDFKRHSLVSNVAGKPPQKIDNIQFGFGSEVHANPWVQDLNESRIDLRYFESYKSISLFPKGQFKIDENIKPIALKTFYPLVDSILRRAEPQNYKSLVVQILIYGYTDAVPIAENSPLRQTLAPYMKKIPMTSENINVHLSYLRAKEIGKIIDEIIEQRKPMFDPFDKVYIQIVHEGKGQELPDRKKKYRIDDERRRVVKIYWKIL
nr:hypothetical protein [Chitinophagaceae bacterium]